MNHLRRGISPTLLIDQVSNTMPYLFESRVEGTSVESALLGLPPADCVRKYSTRLISAGLAEESEDHADYFRLCLSAHYLTCGTPVPTDVDNQIRLKLWPENLPEDLAFTMARFVLESRSWDFTLLSTRFVYGVDDLENQNISGHLGEWFTVATAAYSALRRYSTSPPANELRGQLFEAIAGEIRKHSEIFGSLWRAKQGLGCLKASAIVAHNFGDLDRVMDMWEMPVNDPLRLEFYHLTASPFDPNKKLRYLGRLWVAGELYKSLITGTESSSMALENHRHFALRKPKCLRRSAEFLIPIGPFFDDWGKRVARGLASPEGKPTEETFEVISALRHGWEKLPRTVGYGRALRGILEVHPQVQIDEVAKIASFQAQLETPQEVFEAHWSQKAIQLMDDIPSRAQ